MQRPANMQDSFDLPFDVWMLIIHFADKELILKLLLLNKDFNQTAKEILNTGSNKTSFDFFTSRAHLSQSFLSSPRFTAMTPTSASQILTGTNQGFFISVNEKNKLTGSEIYSGTFFNDEVIAVKQFDSNCYMSLSDKGLIKLLSLNGDNLSEIDRMQLKTKSILPNWVTHLDNGHFAILNTNQLGLFEVYFVSFDNNKIKIQTISGSTDFKNAVCGIDKIHPGQGDVIYAIAYAKKAPEALWRRLLKFSIENGFQYSTIESITDDTSYGQSLSCSLAMISDASSEPFLVGFDLCSCTSIFGKKEKYFFINRLCTTEKSAFYNDPTFGINIKFSTIPRNHYNANIKIDPNNPFLQILPNQHLFVREKDQFVIYAFPLTSAQSEWDPYSFTIAHSIKLPADQKVEIKSVISTDNGNVLINCGDHIYEWHLKENNLVKKRSDSQFMLEDKFPSKKI